MAHESEFQGDGPVGFIGAGRLGSSLAIAMDRAGYEIIAIHRRSPSKARLSLSSLAGSNVTDRPQQVVEAAKIIFITTPDDVIYDTVNHLDWGPNQAVIHCSGAMPVSLLRKARDQRAAVGGMHPIQTFPTEDSHDSFKGVTFGLESENPKLIDWMQLLSGNLGGRHIELLAHERPAYHASTTMACGLITGLVGLATKMWSSMGRSREDALIALTPLVMATAGHLSELGIPRALTGPYVRGDVETVSKHLHAVSVRGQDMALAYAALALATIPLAIEQGVSDPDSMIDIESMLRTAIAAGLETPN